MLKIATPISQLFEIEKDVKAILQVSDCLECRDHSFVNSLPQQEIFHCELQPIHELSDSDFAYLAEIKRTKLDLKLISFHAASCCHAPVLVEMMFQPGGRAYTRDQMLTNAKANLAKIREIFENKVEIAVENNNYYPTAAYQFVTDADFIFELVYENDIMFVFDCAHAIITSHNKKICYQQYRQELPLDRTLQIHLSKPGLGKNGVCFDFHELIDHREIDELYFLMQKTKHLKYLTVEYYKDADNLVKIIRQLKKLPHA